MQFSTVEFMSDPVAKAMMESLAKSITAETPQLFGAAMQCMRQSCQQTISKCRQGKRAPCSGYSAHLCLFFGPSILFWALVLNLQLPPLRHNHYRHHY